jgi:hypothetical protein
MSQRELALELSKAERLGPIQSKLTVSEEPTVIKTNFGIGKN